MVKKICPHCGKTSFSSDDHFIPWICPNCGKDITTEPTRPIEAKDLEKREDVLNENHT